MEAIIQSEAAECGLACLVMIASHHGGRLSMRETRRRYALSLKGATLAQIREIAGQMGFMSRALRLDMDQIDALQVPCILHWNLDHFVVLSKVRKKSVTIFDPAIGQRKLSRQEVSRHFTGVALELSPVAPLRPSEPERGVPLSQLLGPVAGFRRSLSIVLMLSLALQAFVLLAPFYMQWVVDGVLVAADQDLLTILGVGFFLALVLQVGIGLVRGLTVIHISNRLGFQWSANVYSHLIRLPLDFYEKRHVGDITSRMGSVQAIQRTLTTSFVEAIIDGMMALVSFGMMLVYSWKLALITLLAVGAYFLSRALSFSALRRGTEHQLAAGARRQTHLLESIRGIQSVKVAGREEVRRARYANLLSETIDREVWLGRFSLAFGSANQVIFGAERIAVIWIGATLAMQNVFSVGMLIAYLAYKEQFAQRIAALVDKLMEFRMLRLHGERLSDIVLAEAESGLADGEGRPLPDNLTIEVKDVSFRYASGEPWVLRHCSLVIEPGEFVAIIGPSGCGKTTLLKLLLGLLQPTEGEVRIGGVPLRQISIDEYRSILGAVMQDDQLFAGSISDNIAFEDDTVDEDAVKHAARLAAMDDDIRMMPMGYSSLVGDMGAALSGGQKQRLILARALYRVPKLLFLDEATSHLDIPRERQVSDAVRSLDLTRVIIAHRPETIARADRVLELRHGTISVSCFRGSEAEADQEGRM